MPVYLFLYSIFLYGYKTAIKIAAFWNPKARAWIEGRKTVSEQLRRIPAEKKTIWMHCASLGEFEQGRPLLEAIRKKFPEKFLVLTFFSPSGYEIRKNYSGADLVLYLPLGGKASSRQFVRALNPEMVFWIKYDYWYHYLSFLHKSSVPLYLISASFRRNQPFFSWYGKLHRQMLGFFTHMFVQTENSQRLLEHILPSSKITVSGDTRFDRVIEIAAAQTPVEGIADFVQEHPVVVAGSTWPEDIEELDHYANTRTDIRFIIAPHEVVAENIQDIRKLMPAAVTYSEMLAGQPTQHILIIDNIGMLSQLYRFATIAYIGGGFGDDGVHNVPEAAVYGIPVVFGPVFDKYLEAIDLLEEGAAYTVESALELEATFDRLFNNPDLYRASAASARQYIYGKAGATERIMRHIW